LFTYKRHQPEDTLLFKLIKEYYPLFENHLKEKGRTLPIHVKDEFEDYLKCGLLEYGFLRIKCTNCSHERLVAFSCKRRGFCPSCCAKRMIESAALLIDNILPYQPMRQWVLSFPYPLRFLFASHPQVLSKVLGIVYRAISACLIKKAGLTKKKAKTGAVTLIQRFGSALNLNIHFHMLFLDGVYITNDKTDPIFVPIGKLEVKDIANVVNKISLRIAAYLSRAGLIERDADNTYLALDRDNVNEDQVHSIQYRIAIGPNKGKKIFTLQTLPPRYEEQSRSELVSNIGGFSLHAGVAISAYQRAKLENLCRYITRPPVSTERLTLTPQGNVRYELKNPYHDGTTHAIFSPLDFISKLAALIPAPRIHLSRYHGIFASHAKNRDQFINQQNKTELTDNRTEKEKVACMRWAMRLKRAFNIDITLCEACGGPVKVIASIEDPAVIEKILKSIKPYNNQILLPISRAPPTTKFEAL
jgi:hypothetical protein